MENTLTIIFIFIIGTLIGSFLNVVIFRIPKGESISFPPSHCQNCKTRLTVLDLIPIISYIYLRGKCRTCGEKVSVQYPIIEGVTGLVFIFTYVNFGVSFAFLEYAIILSLLVAIFVIDYKHYIIPDGMNLLIFLVALGFLLVGFFMGDYGLSDILYRFYGLILGGGFFLLVAIITGAMGGGDIKIMAALGFLFGFTQTLVLIFFSFIIGGVMSGLLLVLKLKKRKDHIPFGPFICIAAFITIFWGEDLIRWYTNLL